MSVSLSLRGNGSIQNIPGLQPEARRGVAKYPAVNWTLACRRAMSLPASEDSLLLPLPSEVQQLTSKLTFVSSTVSSEALWRIALHRLKSWEITSPLETLLSIWLHDWSLESWCQSSHFLFCWQLTPRHLWWVIKSKDVLCNSRYHTWLLLLLQNLLPPSL